MLEEAGSALEVRCLECGAVERDVFEVIPPRTLMRLRCWSCETRFGAWLDECGICSHEVLVELPDGVPFTPNLLPGICPHCHAQEAFHEDIPSDSDLA